MASLPSEILFQIFRNFPSSDPPPRQFLLTARLTSRQFNDVLSDILLRSWTFSLGTSLDSTIGRCSEISSSPFNANITGLKLTTLTILPENLASKTSERDWWVQAPFWTPSKLTEEFAKNAQTHFDQLTEAVVGLVQSIGSNIRSLTFEIEHVGDGMTVYSSTFIANFFAVAEAYLQHVEKLEIRLVDTGHLTSLPAGPIISNAVPNSDAELLLRSHPGGWKIQEGIDRDIYHTWRRNRNNVPPIFDRIKQLGITLLHGTSKIFEHEVRGVESIGQVMEFMCQFSQLESITFDADGSFIFLPQERYLDVRGLRRLRICNARMNVGMLLRDLGMLKARQEQLGGELEWFEMRDVVFTAEGGEAVSVDSNDTMEALFDGMLERLPGLTSLRVENVRNLEPIEVGDIGGGLRFRLPVPLEIEGCLWDFRRAVYTRREEDVGAFINLWDVLLRRREEKEMKKDPWLQFCVEYGRDVVLMD